MAAALNGHAAPIAGNGRVGAPQQRLGEQRRLGSVIFGCTNATYDECITNGLFGSPYQHHTYVDYIVPGMPIFLFNHTERTMYGIFEATSAGSLHLSPHAWARDRARTMYPAQVLVRLREDLPRIVTLPETVFREALEENYYTPAHFSFELDSQQTERLIQLF